MLRLIVWCVCGGCLLTASVSADSPRKPSFKSIFDGKTLKGWRVHPTNATKDWSVVDGTIYGSGSKSRSYLVLDHRPIADFELKLSYRFRGAGNSGISIRAIPDETGKRSFQSYHADFGHVGIGKNVLGAWDFHTPGRSEHRCFRGDRLVIDANDQPMITPIQDPITIDKIHKGGWNDVHIVARGNHFQFFLNGKLASEFTEHLPKNMRLLKGEIQLQLHDPAMVVQFRKVQLRVLD